MLTNSDQCVGVTALDNVAGDDNVPGGNAGGPETGGNQEGGGQGDSNNTHYIGEAGGYEQYHPYGKSDDWEASEGSNERESCNADSLHPWVQAALTTPTRTEITLGTRSSISSMLRSIILMVNSSFERSSKPDSEE